MPRIVSVDFETFYKDGEYSIKNMGASSYIRDPRFDPYLISVFDGKEAWAGQPKNFNWDALNDCDLLSHNRYFDNSVHDRMVKLGLAPAVRYNSWQCTANLTTYLCMRRDLARASEFLLGIQADKSYRIDADGKHWDDIVADGKAEKVLEAGRVDAARCWQFWAKFGHLWPENERRLSNLTIDQGRRGVQIDAARLKRDLIVAEKALIQAESVLPWMKDGKKPTSPKAVAEECRKNNIPCAPVKSRDGEEAFDEWAATYGPKHQWVKAFTDYKVIYRLIGILKTIETRLDPDAIFAFDLLYFGAHTGRWKGGGGFNIQNIRKEPYYIDCQGWLVTDEKKLKDIDAHLEAQKGIPEWEKTLPEWIAHSINTRAYFIPRPGRKLIIPDLSQIEPRCLHWLVNDRPMIEGMQRGQSPYEAHARASMNWTAGDLKKEDKNLYALAKARVLALGFGCGWEKFIVMAWQYAQLDITEGDPEFVQAVNDDGQPCFNKDGTPRLISGYGQRSRQTVNDYRASNPLIAGPDGIWKRLDDAFKDSVGSDFKITLPSGRQLTYADVKRERKAVPNPDDPKKWSHRWVTTALMFNEKRNAVVRTPSYGGKLTENLVQAMARDVFGENMLKLVDSGADVLFSVHDEAPVEVDQSVTPRDIEQVMSYCPEWCPGLPVKSEAKEAPHYLK